ncbi:LytR C-terminal domain-containing protein [Microbacterium capsulatum]|uniref:LytR C-terminal domain-containing protein n=1 Tax=Microbacterium capsulatum TaxID=3041921 RepID=A0ABU0XHA4_9MICO|nr:LytR C-terminal domain-containing protein [Microbacterium sp. ASV81]MDQ4214446.1 LytR C-terminal domain-containing protein [Microbacterium sp. ASV81]
MPAPERDRFDVIPHAQGRVGAHRAENPGMRGWFTLLWATIATVVLIAVGIFAAMFAMGKFGTEAGGPMPSASPSASVSKPALDTSYAVFVLNGTTATGLAASTRDSIVNAGFPAAAVAAADADEQSFPVTTVYYQAPADKRAADALAALIGATKTAQSNVYSNDVVPDQKQLTVVLGLDKAKGTPTAAPTPTR